MVTDRWPDPVQRVVEHGSVARALLHGQLAQFAQRGALQLLQDNDREDVTQRVRMCPRFDLRSATANVGFGEHIL